MRWSRTVLLLDGGWLLAIGLALAISIALGHVVGPGPYAVGFMEATLLVAVAGGGLLAAGLLARRRVLWHAFAIGFHVVLLSVDLGFLPALASIGLPASVPVVEAVLHTLFVAAHGAGIVKVRGGAPAS